MMPIDQIINEYEKKRIEEKIIQWTILVALCGIFISIIFQSEIEFFDTTTLCFLTVLMAGLTLQKWISIKQISGETLDQDIARLFLYSNFRRGPAE